MSLLQGLRLWYPDYPLAKLFCYAAGSSAKRSVYTTPALTVAHANPVIADATGLFPTIFRDPAIAYDFWLAPSTDTDPPQNEIFTVLSVTEESAGLVTILTKTANYSLVATDGDDVVILADATLGAITISLYTAIGNTGRKVTVVKTDTTANTVTVDPFSTQTWGGLTSRVLRLANESTAGVSDGTNWVELGQTGATLSATDILATQVFGQG